MAYQQVENGDEYIMDVLKGLASLDATDPDTNGVVLATHVLIANMACGTTVPSPKLLDYLTGMRNTILGHIYNRDEVLDAKGKRVSK